MRTLRTGTTLAVVALLAGLVACGGKGGGVAGTYVVDRAQLKKDFREQILQNVPAENRKEAEAMFDEQMDKQLDQMNVQVTLKSDGTYTAEMSGPNNKESDSGTWKLDGKTLTFTSTDKDSNKTKTATYEDGKIHLTDESVPFPMLLVKK
jgi:hypothetical protein